MTFSQTVSESPSSISGSLLERVKAHDGQAWQHLAKLYGPLVLRWCLRARLQTADAEDVVQEVFAKVATAIGGFRRERPGDTFCGWLWTITHHALVDHRRRQRGQLALLPGSELLEGAVADDCEDASGDSGPHDIGALYRRALELIGSEFEPRSWQAFWQVAVEGRCAADVAHELGMTTNAVYIAKSRVFRRLRDELG